MFSVAHSPATPRSLAEKWAALAAVHDVFDMTGDKVLPWPLPADEEDLVAFTTWTKGEGGAFWGLMNAASRLTDTETEWVRRWLEDVKQAHGTGGEPPTAKSGKGKGKGGAGTTPEQPNVNCRADRETILRGLQPAIRKAYLAFQYAESKVGKELQDHEAYELLQDEGIPTDKGDRGELTDYELPTFDTWRRQVSEARRPLGEQKYTPRGGRSRGGSIVKSDKK